MFRNIHRLWFVPGIALLQACFFMTLHAFAQTVHHDTAVMKSNSRRSYLSEAIAKGYNASVLMWEIEPESGERRSAQFSGVVVSKEGIILSAAHVVMPGKNYRVMFANGRECVAAGLGRIAIPPDFMLPDAAMLKIKDQGTWPFAEMGWSAGLTPGTPCISIAYPESLEQRKPTVRFGHITLEKNKYGFLQSSCAMEPGDSGGPLFDLSGRVIGIHSGIEVPEDVNYEVPVNTFRKFWNALSKPVNYTALPADSVKVPANALAAQLKAASVSSGLQNIRSIPVDVTCVQIKSTIAGKEVQIVGTVIATDDLFKNQLINAPSILISKSSMVGEAPVVILANGNIVKAAIVARNRLNDLVLLRMHKIPVNGVSFYPKQKDTIGFENLGEFLVSPVPGFAAKIGVIGSTLINLPPVTSYGYIGASTNVKENKLVITYVEPNSAAQINGLQTGDVIQTVGGRATEDQLDFLRALQNYLAGDTVMVEVNRNGKAQIKAIALGYPPQKVVSHPAWLFAGGKSIRRDGFDGIFVHDSAIKAYECGGPVFDASGHFAGINIARFSRTSTVTIPATLIRQFVLKNLGKIR